MSPRAVGASGLTLLLARKDLFRAMGAILVVLPYAIH
jgi:hypothetical protein